MSDRQFRTRGRVQVDDDLDLERCHRDPIELNASIQPHGTMLHVDPESLEVQSAAENTASCLGGRPSELLGASVDAFLDDSGVEAIRDHASRELQHMDLFISEAGSERTVASVFNLGEDLGLEFDTIVGDEQSCTRVLASARSYFDRLRTVEGRDRLREEAVRVVREITDMDRVMFYEFGERGDGRVVAEECEQGVRSFLGQRFPASDIPEPARRLYRKNTLRYIPDVEPDPVRIVGPEGPRDRRELDLTYSGLRAVPRVHCRYLRNMGVAGSMSISFVVEGELAGLLACHSVEPVAVGWSRRELCRQVGQIVADRLAGLRATRRERRIRELDDLEEEVDDTSGGYEELLEQIGHHRDRWLQGLNASGMHLCLRDRTLWLTDEETRRAGGELLDWIESELVEHSRVAVDSIVEEIDAEWDRPAVAGFLAVRLGETASSYAVWFRPEERRTVEWAGDPRRPASLDDGEERIDPRQSFETWTQEVAGRCAPWSETDRAVADACRKLFSRLTLETQYAQLQTLNEQLEVINERNRELVERLDQVARTDDLTGLPNRRELNRRVREEVDRAERYQSALSFILLDIDHFKSINDERGHRAGDRVLEEVGSLLDGETRGPDLPARYGGEEFAVLLPNTELDEAVELAERLLEALRSHRFELDDDSISVTCSAGVSSLRAGDDAEALIGRADEAMYRAKDAGRDRVESEEVER